MMSTLKWSIHQIKVDSWLASGDAWMRDWGKTQGKTEHVILQWKTVLASHNIDQSNYSKEKRTVHQALDICHKNQSPRPKAIEGTEQTIDYIRLSRDSEQPGTENNTKSRVNDPQPGYWDCGQAWQHEENCVCLSTIRYRNKMQQSL